MSDAQITDPSTDEQAQTNTDEAEAGEVEAEAAAEAQADDARIERLREAGVPEHLLDKYDDLDIGGREDAIIDESSTERKFYVVEGKVYWFDFRDVSWAKKNSILDENVSTDAETRSVDMNTRGYYRDMMEYLIVDSSIEGSLPLFLQGMKSELGDRLQGDIPDPITAFDEDEEGNSDEPSDSTTETQTTQG